MASLLRNEGANVPRHMVDVASAQSHSLGLGRQFAIHTVWYTDS